VDTKRTLTRRNLFGDSLREVAGVVREAKEAFEQASEGLDVFASLDTSYTLTRHYPRELFEEEAAKLGVDIDEVGIDEAVRLIFAQHGYNPGAES
jgi:hypothetical protein